MKSKRYNKEDGNLVKVYRLKKGFSQKKLAEELGVCRDTVRNWEAGNPSPLILKIIKLEKIINDLTLE